MTARKKLNIAIDAIYVKEIENAELSKLLWA
jgi:hypothetical protein